MLALVALDDNQKRLARQWAERIKSAPREYHDEMHHAVADLVLAHTKPETMKDVEWDDEEHFLAHAVSSIGDRSVVMLGETTGMITTIDLGNQSVVRSTPNNLVPTGKRYKLVEVTERDHPEFLETVEDYRNAPEGTVVARDHLSPWWKTDDDTWERIYDEKSDTGMAFQDGVHKVLRWGDEA